MASCEQWGSFTWYSPRNPEHDLASNIGQAITELNCGQEKENNLNLPAETHRYFGVEWFLVTLDFIAGLLFIAEPYSTFIMKDLSFHRTFTIYHEWCLWHCRPCSLSCHFLGADVATLFWVLGTQGTVRDCPALERITNRNLGVQVRRRSW